MNGVLHQFERTALDDAREWLTAYLRDGPRPARDIYREAGQAGIAKRTLDRAKCDLRITARRQGFGAAGGWVWELPAKDRLPKVANPYVSDLAAVDDRMGPGGPHCPRWRGWRR